jgi:hypothetical protein
LSCSSRFVFAFFLNSKTLFACNLQSQIHSSNSPSAKAESHYMCFTFPTIVACQNMNQQRVPLYQKRFPSASNLNRESILAPTHLGQATLAHARIRRLYQAESEIDTFSCAIPSKLFHVLLNLNWWTLWAH